MSHRSRTFLKAAHPPATLPLAQAYFEFCVPLEQVDDHSSVSQEIPVQIVTNPAICFMVCSTFACFFVEKSGAEMSIIIR